MHAVQLLFFIDGLNSLKGFKGKVNKGVFNSCSLGKGLNLYLFLA